MRVDFLTLALLLGATSTSALPNNQGGKNVARDGHGSWSSPAPPAPTGYEEHCGDKCGGVCGDGIIQAPEECDLGPELNGKEGSGCTADCRKCPVAVCGDGKLDQGEEVRELTQSLVLLSNHGQCDLGAQNGVPGSGCDKSCKTCAVPVCGDGKLDEGEEVCVNQAICDTFF